MSQKILVIDDSLAASKLAENVMAQNFNGVDVLLAQRGADAFERFNVAQPDLIILNESMPDMDAEAICYRLLNDPATAKVPVVLLATNGNGDAIEERYDNVIRVLPKPVTPESLLEVLTTALSKSKSGGNPARQLLFHDASRTVFSGHTAFFSLRSALQMAYGDRLTGVLRFFINRFPIELFINKGRFLFATTRNFQLYCRESPVILSATNLGLIVEGQTTQAASGCPIFLFLSVRNGFPHDDVVQIVRDHGMRVFSSLWTAGRVMFEFEELQQFPEYVRNFPPANEDPDNWILGSLRHVRFDALMGMQRPDPNGSPAYTRKGYELIQKLKLNDVEARFATAINGAESLQSIAKKIGIPLNDALLIVFRFAALDIIDYWSSNVLSLPGAVPTNGGGVPAAAAAS
ncbi:MAG TPA: response regulator [Chthoniobacteraceae bacterium]|jgi:CheY-like chemotaxis protein|nr:Response regulator receiver protein [Chthoniobacter sp.]HEV7868155.1 response regulator [Chthoniobacteraceae bacterium]